MYDLRPTECGVMIHFMMGSIVVTHLQRELAKGTRVLRVGYIYTRGKLTSKRGWVKFSILAWRYEPRMVGSQEGGRNEDLIDQFVYITYH